MHPTITQMYVAARQDEIVRVLRDSRRGRTAPRRHLLRRTHTDAR